MADKKQTRFADYRSDGEPGVEVYALFFPLRQKMVFASIGEAAEFLNMDADVLTDYLEAEQQ